MQADMGENRGGGNGRGKGYDVSKVSLVLPKESIEHATGSVSAPLILLLFRYPSGILKHTKPGVDVGTSQLTLRKWMR